MDLDDQPTCGKGLAEHSVLPAKLGELIAATAENLELHMQALDRQDPDSELEYRAYQKLAREHREIAASLISTAREMAGYRDLRMGRHDAQAMSDPKLAHAFEKFVDREQELLALLRMRLEQDQRMLGQMSGAATDL